MKILVMGDGGALWLPTSERAERARMLRNMGLDTSSGTDALKCKQARWWEYTVKEPSGRFASNDLVAAVGRVQLAKLASFVQRRAQVWRSYQAELASVGDLVLPPEPSSDCTTSYYLYWVQTGRRDALARWLVDHDIYCTFRYFPLHIAFRDTTARCPNATLANERGLCLPLHQNLTDQDVDKIILTVKEFYRG
jgi:aminotransferase